MTDVAFISYVPDPFSVQASHFKVRDPRGNDQTLDAATLSALDGPLMTIDAPALVDDLRRLGYPPPASLLDLGEALKLSVGRSKDDGGEKQWNIWPALAGRFGSYADAKRFERLALARSDRPTPEQVSKLLTEALDAIVRLWNDLECQLKKLDEYQRLVTIEWPLQSLFAYRQFRGVRVDPTCANRLLGEISAEKYSAYRTVAEILKESPTGLNFWNITDSLPLTDVSHLARANFSCPVAD